MSAISTEALMYTVTIFNWNTGHPCLTNEFYIPSLDLRVNLTGDCVQNSPCPEYLKNSIRVDFPIELAEKVNKYYKHLSELWQTNKSGILYPKDYVPLWMDLSHDLKSYEKTL